MKTYAIVLIVLGSVIAAIIILYWLCGGGRKKKKQSSTPNPIPMRSVTTPSVQRSYPADPERGEVSKTAGGTKDGGMAILVGAGAGLATAAVIDGITSGCGGTGGGDNGGGGGGDGGGGDGGGGGGCGGCGGCGG
ncbi:hypothetical protein TIFTF001_043387 [Ficus carica]|uniref:Uncharacterized protein n=1 Tax=Ficus carica TaxID=3494 RepID=A0AA87YSL2_FICCA|nr:hypothetical protein TIFTF001_043387 [Ficus carica]